MNEHLLTLLVVLPLIGAAVVLFSPRQSPGLIRSLSTAFMVAEFLISLRLLRADFSTQGSFLFTEKYSWVSSFGIHYNVGVDGISLWLILLTTFVTPIALYASWSSIDTKVKEFAFSFLLLESAMVGAFVALDLFLFYIFWELMLIPMLFIIGVWGGPRRIYAALKFFLYTMVGSLLMLIAIFYVVYQYKALSGAYSFDIRELRELVLPHQVQFWLFLAFALAFAIKVPMFPFHTWLPDAHVEAPTGGSVILAAVLLKLGGYGFIRFAMPLFPYASHNMGPTLAVLAILGILYGAYCAWVQYDIKKLVAYSSVSHLGFVMLGILSMNVSGLQGALLQMISHGISTGALFLLVGVVYERRHTRDLEEFGGLAQIMPAYAVLFGIVTMSSIGLPGTNGFVGEFMILSGTFLSERLRYPTLLSLFAAIGVVLAAVYMLHAMLKMFWGPVSTKENEQLSDLQPRELVALVPLVLFVFWIGFYPKVFLDQMTPAVQTFRDQYEAKLQFSYTHDVTQLLSSTPTAEKAEDKAENHVAAAHPAATQPTSPVIAGSSCGANALNRLKSIPSVAEALKRRAETKK